MHLLFNELYDLSIIYNVRNQDIEESKLDTFVSILFLIKDLRQQFYESSQMGRCPTSAVQNE